MIFNKKSLEKLKTIFSGDEKKILVYHRDADGVCSAALIMKFFSPFKTICREGPILDDKIIKYLIQYNPQSITFIDIPVDQHHEKLIHLKEKIEGVKISIIDHHPFERDMNKEGMIHINNMLLDEYKNSYIPTSCIIWRIFSEMELPTDECSWIAGIGVIGDYGPKECMDVIENVKKQNPELVKGDIMGCGLSKGADMISASITVRGIKGAYYSLSRLKNAENFYDFISDPNLVEWNEKLQDEVEKIMKDLEESSYMDKEKRILMYEIKSDLSISSIISTVVSEKYPDHVIIIYKKWNENAFKVSLRCQDGHVDVGQLAKECSKDIGTGGGHKKAAGALINKDWETFRKRIFDYTL